MLRHTLATLGFAVGLAALPAAAFAQMSDADYIAKVSAAAPADVIKGATIVQVGKDGSMRTLQTGTNGFTCMMLGPSESMCADKNAMAWMHAMMSHSAPPDVVGFAYMLGGDEGASNTDPMAREKTADNHWVVTGPHVMIFSPSTKTMGYPMAADANASAPYVMWADTPYAHVMIPVAAAAPPAP